MMKWYVYLLLFFLISFQTFSTPISDEQKRIALDKSKVIVESLNIGKLTDFEKIIILHEYITENVSYGFYKNETNAYTALVHNRSDCVGFARGFAMLLDVAGVDNFVVVREKGHLWNRVKIDGKYFNIDNTWSAVKSSWVQYSWFLLSDSQNYALDHNLDSGEKYEECKELFVFKPDYYIHNELLYNKKKIRIMGNIKLPDGIVAPEGGITLSINGVRSIIPKGSNSVFFITFINRDDKSEKIIKVSCTNDGVSSFAKQSFFNGKELVVGKNNSFLFDVNSSDITGLDLVLPVSLYSINGKIVFPEGSFSPKGGVYVSMELFCLPPVEKRVTFYDWIFIDEGENEKSFKIDIDKKYADNDFFLYYYSGSLEKNGFKKVGYYTLNKSGLSIKEADKISLKDEKTKDIKIKIIK